MGNSTIPTKRCGICGEEYPLTREYFHRSSSNKDGFHTYCISCAVKYSEERRRQKGQKPYKRSSKPGYKICTQCERELPATTEYFYKKKLGHYGLDSRCKECRKYDNEKRKDYNRDYHQKHGQKRRAQNRERGKKNRPKLREYYRNWRYQNPDKANLSSELRRARKLSLPYDFTIEDWQKAQEYFNHCCAVCGRPPGNGFYLAKDHWIPITKGGGTTTDNIVPLCHAERGSSGGCNNTKHNRMPEVWLVERFGDEQAKAILEKIEIFLKGRRRSQ